MLDLVEDRERETKEDPLALVGERRKRNIVVPFLFYFKKSVIAFFYFYFVGILIVSYVSIRILMFMFHGRSFDSVSESGLVHRQLPSRSSELISSRVGVGFTFTLLMQFYFIFFTNMALLPLL